MASQSSIEWTDATWNPVTGCSKVSAGCQFCYAERLAFRLRAMGQPRYVDGFSVRLHHDLLDLPRRWRSPRLVFVNSMSDLFHESVPLPIEVEARGSSQSMVKVSQGLIRAWMTVLPPIRDQRAIAVFLDRETMRIDALIARIREAIDRLKELRTALISAAVTGKIDVREEVA